MAQFYKVLKADPLGDPWTPNFADAKPLQRFWCQVEGEEWAVSINKQVPGTVSPGEHIYGDLAKTTSAKGNNYWTFKSAKVPDGVQRPSNDVYTKPTQTQAPNYSAEMPDWFMPVANQIDYIFREMRKMDSTYQEPAADPLAPEVEPEAKAGIDEDTQAMLDEIFTKDEDKDASTNS